jgi:hypothetical protein
VNARFKYYLVLAISLILGVSGGTAAAQIDLRFDPPDTTFEPGATTFISVMLDDAIFIRTVELRVSYDPTFIGTVSGGPGALFNDSNFQIWPEFIEDVPGQWYGFAVIIGATDSLSGPGELFAWEIQGLIEGGATPITAIEAKLYEPNAMLIPDVTLAPTTIRVRVAPSGVDDLPAFLSGLELFPNPFNPSTQIGFDLPVSGQVLLSVFDSRGRRIATLHEGPAVAGPLHFEWDGRDDRGLVQPGGVYLFRLDSRQGGVTHTATTKGILLK